MSRFEPLVSICPDTKLVPPPRERHPAAVAADLRQVEIERPPTPAAGDAGALTDQAHRPRRSLEQKHILATAAGLPGHQVRGGAHERDPVPVGADRCLIRVAVGRWAAAAT